MAAASVGVSGCVHSGIEKQQGASAGRNVGVDVRAVSLGNLRVGKPPTAREAQLSMFLFGVEPPSPMGFFKPMDCAAGGAGIVVTDAGVAAVVSCDGRGGEIRGVTLEGAPGDPNVVAEADGGALIVADGGAGVAKRYDARGRVLATYRVEGEAFRPAGAAVVGGELWITNAAAHRIEVFGLNDGSHRRFIGGRGRNAGEFGVPLGMAVTAEGEVCVVDMLNCRVQVLAADGTWIRDIGGAGANEGRFGRPKDVAVGPDGTIFVTDAASQTVQAFDRWGRFLSAFGGMEAGEDQLLLPAGVAVASGPIAAEHSPPEGVEISYYVLVAEQFLKPGIRVYGWRPEPRRPATGRAAWVQREEQAPNPHWDAGSCRVCHESANGTPGPIPIGRADGLCLSCHDGKKAHEEAHPIGWAGQSETARTPAEWPLNNGLLSCLTCHEIRRQCSKEAERPEVNPGMVRGFDSEYPLKSCTQCHRSENWRVNPHGSERIAGSNTESCGFCHAQRPAVDERGRRQGMAHLRQAGSAGCLTCHVMHADPAPKGHLGAIADKEMRAAIVEAELRRGMEREGAVANSELLPLAEGAVACFTCHNPHSPSMWAADTALGARAVEARSAGIALRVDALELCVICHKK